MALETFDFPYFTCETINPETGFRGKFGGSYTFSATPNAPDQRIFKLHFNFMKFYVDSNGDLDETTDPKFNMKVLINFYHLHKLHKKFSFSHPVYGTVVCKFNKPLQEPKGIPGGTGAVEGFEIELLEIP